MSKKPLLKACPFCGSYDIKVSESLFDDWFYQCQTCTTTGPNGADLESATLQWNTREEPEPWVPEADNEKPKKRPCLKCDVPFLCTAEHRICKHCQLSMQASGLNSGYAAR